MSYVHALCYTVTFMSWCGAASNRCYTCRLTALLLLCLQKTYGKSNGLKWFVRWRLFYLACSELFNYNHGNEWGVCHYVFTVKRDAPKAGNESHGKAAEKGKMATANGGPSANLTAGVTS